MFFHTHTGDAPWTVVKSDDKKRARLNCIRAFLHHLDYPGKDVKAIARSDPLIASVPGTTFTKREQLRCAYMTKPDIKAAHRAYI